MSKCRKRPYTSSRSSRSSPKKIQSQLHFISLDRFPPAESPALTSPSAALARLLLRRDLHLLAYLAIRSQRGRVRQHADDFLQEHIQKREFVAKKAKGADNPADAGTKNLTEQKMNRMLNMIGAKIMGGAILASQVKSVNALPIQVVKNEAADVMHAKAVMVASDALVKVGNAMNGAVLRALFADANKPDGLTVVPPDAKGS